MTFTDEFDRDNDVADRETDEDTAEDREDDDAWVKWVENDVPVIEPSPASDYAKHGGENNSETDEILKARGMENMAIVMLSLS